MDSNYPYSTAPVLTVAQLLQLFAFADECKADLLAQGEEPCRIYGDLIKPAIPLN